MRSLAIGFALCRKSDKTEEEERAAKSFKVVFASICVLMAIFLIGMAIAIVRFVPFDNACHRVGRVENGQIHYVQNTLKYIPLQEVGLTAEEVSEGDEVYLYFDHQDKLISGELESRVTRKGYGIIYYLIISCVVFVLFALISRKTYGRPWTEWYRRYEKDEQLYRGN